MYLFEFQIILTDVQNYIQAKDNYIFFKCMYIVLHKQTTPQGYVTIQIETALYLLKLVNVI